VEWLTQDHLERQVLRSCAGQSQVGRTARDARDLAALAIIRSARDDVSKRRRAPLTYDAEGSFGSYTATTRVPVLLERDRLIPRPKK